MQKERKSPSSSATLYKTGTKKIGNDGNKWIIVENKNGIKKWQLYKKTSKQTNKEPEKEIKLTMDLIYGFKSLSLTDLEKIIMKNHKTKYIYDIIKNKIIPEINKLKIETFIVPLPLSNNNVYWDDYAYNYIKKIYKKDILDINYLYFTFYLDIGGKEINFSRNIDVIFNVLNIDNKIKIIDIFEKYLFQYFIWDGTNVNPINISYDKDNKINQSKDNLNYYLDNQFV